MGLNSKELLKQAAGKNNKTKAMKSIFELKIQFINWMRELISTQAYQVQYVFQNLIKKHKEMGIMSKMQNTQNMTKHE